MDGHLKKDRQLLEDYLAGSDLAFTEIVRRYAPAVLGRCRRLLGEADAEDAAQSVFLVLARRAQTIRAVLHS